MKTNNGKNLKQQNKSKKISTEPGHKKFPVHPVNPVEDVITNPGDILPSESVVNSDSSREAESNDVTKENDKNLKDKNLTDSEVATQKP